MCPEEDLAPATREDIKRLAIELAKTQLRIGRWEDRFQSEVQQLRSELNGRIDGFLRQLETYERETVTIPERLDQHGDWLRGLERRLKTIEEGRHDDETRDRGSEDRG